MGWRTTTSIIPNTTMEIYTNLNGVDTTYRIKTLTGYVIHDKGRDRVTYDNEGNIISKTLGFAGSGTTCSINYDFTTHELQLANGETVTVYGEKEYFTVLIEDLPEEGVIYGGVAPKPEIM